MRTRFLPLLLAAATLAAAAAVPSGPRLRLQRDGNWLVIQGAHLPGGEIRVNYLEAYGDESLIVATAWEPYQELFQGVARCIHSDFRLGGLQPGETRRIRGRIYVVPNDVNALLERYWRDFPETLTRLPPS
jgi:hypothetical protein